MENKLAPKTAGGKLGNFFMNLFWSIVWLGRWTIRLIKRILGHDD